MTGALPKESERQPPLRVRLTEPGPSSVAAMEPWFEATWRAIFGRSGEAVPPVPVSADAWSTAAGTGVVHRLIEVEVGPIGLLSYTPGAHRVTIHELATAPEHRDRGFGAEAVYALEAESGATEMRALVPVTNGLAVYFWLRIGYRPSFLTRHQQRGFTVMVRDVVTDGAQSEV